MPGVKRLVASRLTVTGGKDGVRMVMTQHVPNLMVEPLHALSMQADVDLRSDCATKLLGMLSLWV